MAASQLRCAIYTRKSSEEGLEQGFNSLHAQREACEAYVLSQAGEGWAALPTIYDDGGYSGGSMERPALKQLLSDIERGGIDVVVVYKVDRLTRSLTDFARIVETFDKGGVSFVSVTQAFNTTTSMGRLTLNVLLSFAQFEREVTGERIRDKIAASKAKGMWMGGNVPLGYDIPTDPTNRVLIVNEAEAETVRMIFREYLKLGTVTKLAAELKAQGVTTKKRVSAAGREIGGGAWQEGPLYYVLKNPIYRGLIVHKGKVHAGRHPAIIDEELFEAVQRQLQAKVGGGAKGAATRTGSLLAGKIFDDRGHPMSPTTTKRGGRTHRYYVSQALLRSDRGQAGSLGRVPAAAVEELVLSQLRERSGGSEEDAVSQIERIVVSEKGLKLLLKSSDGTAAEVELAAALRTVGGAKRVTDSNGSPLQPLGPDVALQRAIARGKRWEQQLVTGERAGADDIAAREGLQSRYVDKVLKLAWLAPDITESIISGRRLRDYGLTDLLGSELPMDWSLQRQVFALT